MSSLEILISIFMKGDDSKYFCHAWASQAQAVQGSEESLHECWSPCSFPYCYVACQKVSEPMSGENLETGIKQIGIICVGWEEDGNYCIMLIWDLVLLVINIHQRIPAQVPLLWSGCLPCTKNLLLVPWMTCSCSGCIKAVSDFLA